MGGRYYLTGEKAKHPDFCNSNKSEVIMVIDGEESKGMSSSATSMAQVIKKESQSNQVDKRRRKLQGPRGTNGEPTI